jgi:hypothetical protein
LLSKGLYTVSANHKVYYELHGSAEASERVVFISGLNMASWSFHAAAMHFAAVCTLVFPFTTQGEQLPGYQVLVLDNCGVGHSDSPTASGRLYKTSHMGMRLQYTDEDLILPSERCHRLDGSSWLDATPFRHTRGRFDGRHDRSGALSVREDVYEAFIGMRPCHS